ncbi:MAG: hypothetical protein KAQ83_02650 [Nanoarchaeota archaeon]|nr:hypothetical protein [Nanoarchaeota archaeon]
MAVISFQETDKIAVEKVLEEFLDSCPNTPWPHINGAPSDDRPSGKLNSDPCLLVCKSYVTHLSYQLAVYPQSFDTGQVTAGLTKKLQSGSWQVMHQFRDLPQRSNLNYLTLQSFLDNPEDIAEFFRIAKSGTLIEVESFPGRKRIGFFASLQGDQVKMFQGYDLLTGGFESANELTLHNQYYMDNNIQGRYITPSNLEQIKKINIFNS